MRRTKNSTLVLFRRKKNDDESNGQVSGFAVVRLKSSGETLQRWFDFGRNELIDLFGRPADERSRVEQHVEFADDRREIRIVLHSFDQIVVQTFDFHAFSRFLRQRADFLVTLLTISSGRDLNEPVRDRGEREKCVTLTMAMIKFSVAMNGNSCLMCLSITFG